MSTTWWASPPALPAVVRKPGPAVAAGPVGNIDVLGVHAPWAIDADPDEPSPWEGIAARRAGSAAVDLVGGHPSGGYLRVNRALDQVWRERRFSRENPLPAGDSGGIIAPPESVPRLRPGDLGQPAGAHRGRPDPG